MSFLAVITLAEVKEYMKLPPGVSPEDSFVQALCDEAASEIRVMTNRPSDVDFSLIASDEVVKLVGKEMVYWNYEASKRGASRLGITNISDAVSGGSATTTYKNMREEWRKRLMYFRYMPI